MYSTFCRYLGVIILPIITLQLLITSGFTGSEASIIVDVNNMLRDTSTTEVNTMPSATVPSSLSNHRQMTENILRSDNAAYSSDKDTTYYNGYGKEVPSAELLRFVNDNDIVNSETEEDNSNSVDNEIHLSHSQQHIDNTGKNNGANEDDDDDNNNDYMQSLSLRDQVRLLSKQLNVLMNSRREDYELLERNLRKSLRINEEVEKSENEKSQDSLSSSSRAQSNGNDNDFDNVDLRNELETLRLVLLIFSG